MQQPERMRESGRSYGFDFSLLSERVYPVDEAHMNRQVSILDVIIDSADDGLFQPLDIIRSIEFLRNVAFHSQDLRENALRKLTTVAHSPDLTNMQRIGKLEAFLALRSLSHNALCPPPDVHEFSWGGNGMAYGPDRIVALRAPDSVAPVDTVTQALQRHDLLIEKYWPTIQRAGKEFDIDPHYVSALIAKEASQQQSFAIYSRSSENDPVSPQETGREVSLESVLRRYARGNQSLVRRAVRLLWFLEQHRNVVKHFLPRTLSRKVIETAGVFLGQDPTIGLSQIRVGTADRFRLVRLFGNEIPSGASHTLLTSLLFIPSINIAASAAYTRHSVNELTRMQEAGYNLYLPDIKRYNPSIRCSTNELSDDPVSPKDWGISAFASMYSFTQYPEYHRWLSGKSNADREYLLRFPVTRNGKLVSDYFHYYQGRFAVSE